MDMKLGLMAVLILGLLGAGYYFLKVSVSPSQNIPSPVPAAENGQVLFRPDQNKTFTIAAAGDITCPDLVPAAAECQQEATAKIIEQINPEFVLLLGDIQYGGGR